MRQDRLSEYWYAKATMPDSMRANIGALVSGDFAGDISLGRSTTRLLKVDGEVFGRVFTMNREFLYRGDYTAPSDENDYRNADNYLTEDGIAGFSITETGWLVSLFSNCSERGFARAVAGFVSPRAYKLTCIVTDKNPGGGLIELYEKCYGFRPYARTIDEWLQENYKILETSFTGDDFFFSSGFMMLLLHFRCLSKGAMLMQNSLRETGGT